VNAAGVVALVVVSSASLAACTVDFGGTHFCEPGCGGGGSSSSSSQGGAGGTGGAGGASTSSSSTGGGGGGAGGGCPAGTKTPKSDDFSNDLSAWNQLFPELSNPKMATANGQLTITPTMGATWYADGCLPGGCGAPSIVQTVRGDFAIKTHVSVGGQASDFAAAGILLAFPCVEAHTNYVLDIGFQSGGAPGVDFYETFEGTAMQPMVLQTTSTTADLYACRVGDTLRFFVAVDGKPATLVDVMPPYSEPDIEVGLTAHANKMAGVIANFDEAQFRVPMNAADCTNFP
jgi:hypothetical protein